MTKPTVVVVWFKRDLRINDHEPFVAATKSELPIVPVYLYEPSLIDDPHYSDRQWRFVWQSLVYLKNTLAQYQGSLYVSYEEASSFFDRLASHVNIHCVYSHQEIGVATTYARDRHMQSWFIKRGIEWQETPYSAVIRGLTDRENWDQTWQTTMRRDIHETPLEMAQWAHIDGFHACRVPAKRAQTWSVTDPQMQLGGEAEAWSVLNSFFEYRGEHYHRHISKPALSVISCSRLSPYLAWGNLTIRQVYQKVLANWRKRYWSRALRAFNSRLHWHCHFIQKFESESRMEFEPVNAGYNDFPYRDDEWVTRDLDAWCQGQTGYTMVDACMRSLIQTGYLNFRMRAMLVSFLTQHLLIDWRQGVHHLAQQFLDFEPGIHYAQFQMQAGVTGTNTIRIYNPIKQGQEQDPDGTFIQQWLPELATLAPPWIHDPRSITPMEQTMFGYDIPDRYLKPIIELEVAAKHARDLLWSWRKQPAVKKEKNRILARHVKSH